MKITHLALMSALLIQICTSAIAGEVTNETNALKGYDGFRVHVVFMANGCAGVKTTCGRTFGTVCKSGHADPGHNIKYNYNTSQSSRQIVVCDNVQRKTRSNGKYHVCLDPNTDYQLFKVSKHKCPTDK